MPAACSGKCMYMYSPGADLMKGVKLVASLATHSTCNLHFDVKTIGDGVPLPASHAATPHHIMP